MIACKNGHLEIVRLLIQNNANINQQNNVLGNRKSPMMFACEYGHIKIVKFLIENHANINFQNRVRILNQFFTISFFHQISLFHLVWKFSVICCLSKGRYKNSSIINRE